MPVKREWMLVAVLLTAPMATATGNVITNWDEQPTRLKARGQANYGNHTVRVFRLYLADLARLSSL